MRKKAACSEYRPFAQFLILIGIAALCGIFFSVIGMSLCPLLFHLNIFFDPGVLQNYDAPNTVKVLKFLQLVQSVSLFIIPGLLMAWLISIKPLHYVRLDVKPKPVSLILAAGGVLLAVPFINWMGAVNANLHLPDAFSNIETWIRNMEARTGEMEKALLKMSNGFELLFGILLFGVIPAIGEELIFRGHIQQYLTKWFNNRHLAILLTAVFFSAMHMQFLGFFPRWALGMYLGYLLLWTGSLWVPVFVHFVNNSSAVIFEYINNHCHHLDADNIGTLPGQSWMVVLSLVLSILCFFGVYRYESVRNAA